MAQTQRGGDPLRAILPCLGVVLEHGDLTLHLAMADTSICRPGSIPRPITFSFHWGFILWGIQIPSRERRALTYTMAVTRERGEVQDPHGVSTHTPGLSPFWSWLFNMFL